MTKTCPDCKATVHTSLAATPAVDGEREALAEKLDAYAALYASDYGYAIAADLKTAAAALRAQPAAPLRGRDVPNEPTPEMLVAGRMADEDCDMPGQVYRAMIAAAPQALAATPAVGGEAVQAILEDEVYCNRPEGTYDYGDAVARILALFAPPASPLRAIEDALSRHGAMVFLDGRNEHGSHVLPSLPSNISCEYESSLDSYAEEIITAAEKLGFAVLDHVWTEWRWNEPDYGDAGRIEVPGYWEFVRVNADATRALSASPPEQPASPLRGRMLDQAEYKLGWWLAGALEDPNVCMEMKDVINKWFEAHQPNLVMSASSASPPEQPAAYPSAEADKAHADLLRRLAAVPKEEKE